MAEVLIVGGGFAGMWAALSAVREATAQGAAVDVTLVSRDPYLTVRPRLYEVDTESYRVPLAPSLEPAGVRLELGGVGRIDPHTRRLTVETADGAVERSFDRLVIATGSRLEPPPVPGLREHSHNIDDYEGALAFDRHLAAVVREPDLPGGDCYVVLGAGFAGLELAMELRDRIAAHSDEATADAARIVLVEQSPVIGDALGEAPRPAIQAALAEARVELRPATLVEAVTPEAVRLSTGEVIPTRTLVATTGLRASLPVLDAPVERDALGRLITDDMLRVPGLDGVFAAGDAALARADDEHYALMSCQHAIPMGKYAGHNAVRDILGLPLDAFRKPDYVTCLDAGRSGGLFTTGWDRQVVLTGAEAKDRKYTINHVWIEPPRGSREEVLAAADLYTRRPTVTPAASA